MGCTPILSVKVSVETAAHKNSTLTVRVNEALVDIYILCVVSRTITICYCPQRSCGKVIISQVSVCPRGEGVSVQGWSLSRETPPPFYGNVRPVRILLECILVLKFRNSSNLGFCVHFCMEDNNSHALNRRNVVVQSK